MFNREEWLAGLEVGDTVIVSQTFGYDRVSSVSKSQPRKSLSALPKV